MVSPAKELTPGWKRKQEQAIGISISAVVQNHEVLEYISAGMIDIIDQPDGLPWGKQLRSAGTGVKNLFNTEK